MSNSDSPKRYELEDVKRDLKEIKEDFKQDLTEIKDLLLSPKDGIFADLAAHKAEDNLRLDKLQSAIESLQGTNKKMMAAVSGGSGLLGAALPTILEWLSKHIP